MYQLSTQERKYNLHVSDSSHRDERVYKGNGNQSINVNKRFPSNLQSQEYVQEHANDIKSIPAIDVDLTTSVKSITVTCKPDTPVVRSSAPSQGSPAASSADSQASSGASSAATAAETPQEVSDARADAQYFIDLTKSTTNVTSTDQSVAKQLQTMLDNLATTAADLAQ